LLSLVNFSFSFFVCFYCLTIEQFRFKLALNVLQLPEGRGFYHKT
jgi:hypothetical protein